MLLTERCSLVSRNVYIALSAYAPVDCQAVISAWSLQQYAWETNLVCVCSQKLAAVTSDKVVHVFDESGERRDKFKTKAADPNSTQALLSAAWLSHQTALSWLWHRATT